MISDDVRIDLLVLALAWTGYLGLHSLLASQWLKDWVKRHWPRLWGRYRLTYNLVAVGLLLPLLVLTFTVEGRGLWAWQGPWAWLSHAAAVVAIIGFVWSSRAYDLREFAGLRPPAAGEPRLGLSPLHRVVRHPWYFFGLLFLWSRDMDSARLTVVGVITLYIVIGAWLEERKLEGELGAAYREYRQRVPGLLPRPWRILSRADYERLNTQRPPSRASMT